jgi:hypothetical protein
MEVVSKDEYLTKLNEELKRHEDYELGMKFMDIGPGGYHLFDPRHLALQRGEREHDFTNDAFADAISTVKQDFDLDRSTITRAF